MLNLKQGIFFGNIGSILRKEDYTICVTSYKPGDTEADTMHFHDNVQLYLTTRGGSIESRAGKTTELLPGCLRFYHAGEWHQNVRKGNFREGLNVELKEEFLRTHGLSLERVETAAKSPSLQLFLFAAYRELCTAEQDISESVLSLLLAGLSEDDPQRSGFPHWASIVREFLHDRWNEQTTLDELSNVSGVNPITISKHFPRYFGCTLGEYRRRLKTAKAMELLASNKYSLSEIAYVCGFADQSHFIRVFRVYTGRPPGEWFNLSV